MKVWLIKLKKFFTEKSLINFLIYLSFFIGLFLIFYFSQEKQKKPILGGVYREGLFEPIFSLNPLKPENESEKAILNIIYPPLIQFDNGKVFSKFLKNYYFSSDKLTLVLELKKDIRWSDGSQITTDDLYFSFNLYQSSNLPEFDFLKNVELKVIDQRLAEMHLKTNDNYFLYRLAYFRILPNKAFSSADFNEFDINLTKTGSGPFVFSSLINKKDFQILTLTRNNYFYPKPYLDKVEFYVYPSTKRAFDGLLLKEIDGLAGLNYDLSLSILYRYKVYKVTLPRVIGIFFNSQKVDKNLIYFLNQNINRGEINKRIFKNNAEITYGIFSPTLRKIFDIQQLSLQNDQQINIDKNQLTNLEIKAPSTYFYPDIARYLREKFKIKIELLNPKKLDQVINEKNYQAILYGINFSHPPYLSSFFSQAGLNLNNIDDVNLEKNFQALLNDSSININQKIVDIEKQILEKNLNIFLINPYYLYILDKKIKNFDQIYLFNPESRFVKIEYWYKEK